MFEHRGESGEVYNVGSKNELTNISLIELILGKVAEKIGRDENELLSLIQYVDDRKGHDRRYAIDPKKMEESTGWKPETVFADGIASTIEWYISNQKWWERIISGDYMNYYNTQYGERLKP